MQFSRLPRCSSNELINALYRLGCYRGRATRGSHQLFHRDADGRTLTGVVVLGKREVPRRTLRNVLEQLQISPEDLRDALR
ncbi:MAG: addiction module toxin, HicA family [Chloroflexi bacterium]|nr:addiction module toxin, HicA family [Chloroflexota bacterium]MYE40342.1 addiction module toxin, HicA family [Chloroflexota bacterium]